MIIPAIEKNLIYKVPEQERKMKIVGVDGGFSQQSYHGFNMILIRSVAAVFEYDNILKRIAYYPSPEPKLEITDNEEEIINTSMIRQKNEVDTAIGAIKNYSPDIVFMDGR